MKKFRTVMQDNSQSEEINISPLIDVIFILLIFFIVTMAFADKDSLEIDVPTAENSQQPAGSFVSVAIDSNGDIFVDSQMCSLSVLSHRINVLNVKDVVVYSDKNVRAQKLIAVIDAVKAVDGVSIYLATKEK